MKQKLELRQKLVMTQSLQQYLGILQMSNVELEKKIEKEIESNPLLEIKEVENTNNFNLSNYGRTLSTGVDHEMYENIEDSDISIEEFLRKQLFLKYEDEVSRKIGTEIIYSINEAGYLSKSVEEISKKLGQKTTEVEKVLLEMQKFDPPGIFARNLAECITIQLKEMGLFNEDIECVLDYIEFLGQGKYSELVKLCGLTKEKFLEIQVTIRKTNPRPLHGFESGKKNANQYIKSDVVLFKNDYNEWVIELADDLTKRLKINDEYKLIIKKTKSKEGVGGGLSEKLQDANFLIKGVQKRNETIIRVAQEILNVQKEFFEKGDDIELKKLTLKDISEVLELHVSTISRTVNNKYILTPFGVFELKYFFSTGVNKKNGDGHNNGIVVSRKKIMKIIKNLVGTEKDPSMVMSDDKLKDVLKGMGFEISRRAIAKYREEMSIPNSNVRKNKFK